MWLESDIHVYVFWRAFSKGFGLSTGTCGAPPDCSSYTKCDECAAEEACAYNFATKTCLPRSEVGYHLFSFPVCSGSGCACRLGQQAFFVYGLATGFTSCFFAIAAIFGVFALCGALGLGVRKRREDSSPYELGNTYDDDEPAAEPEPLVSSNGKV